MNLEELMASTPPMQQHALIKGFQAGAASRDAEIAYLLEANRIACEDLVEQQNLRVKYARQIEELVSALEDNWNCNPCETTRQQKAFDVAQSVLAKVRKPT